MKSITGIALLTTAIAVTTLATGGSAPRLILTVETPTVSPGGTLRLKMSAPAGSSVTGGGEAVFAFSDSRVTDDQSTMLWHDQLDHLTHERFAKFVINEGTGIVMPKTITVTARIGGKQVATGTFDLQAGYSGHPPSAERGKWVTTFITGGDDHDGSNWYQLYCIRSDAGRCSLDIKDGEHERYHGGQVRVDKHDCDDKGFPQRTLGRWDTLLFDSRKLIDKRSGVRLGPVGHTATNNAVCKIISTGRILLLPVDDRFIAPQN